MMGIATEELQRLEIGEKKKRLRLHIPKGTRLWIFERRLDCMILKHVSRLSVCKILHWLPGNSGQAILPVKTWVIILTTKLYCFLEVIMFCSTNQSIKENNLYNDHWFKSPTGESTRGPLTKWKLGEPLNASVWISWQGKSHSQILTHFSLAGMLKHSLPWESHHLVVTPPIGKTFSALGDD